MVHKTTQKKDEVEYYKLITMYHESQRENKTLRKENKDLREKSEGFEEKVKDLIEKNETLKRRLAY